MSSAGKNSGPDYPTVTVAAGDKGTLSADHVSAQHAPLLHYRPWRGEFGGAERSIWPIARISLRMMFRRKLFWGLYGLGLLIFAMFFFGQYLLAWAETQLAEQTIKVGPVPFEPARLIMILRDRLKFNGAGEMYSNFFWYQGYMVMIVLAMAGSILIGNDFQFGSLPFYLAKPLGRWHYLLGKCLAISFFVNLMTTVPALVLYVQFGLLDSWTYFVDHYKLLFGILGYGLLLTVSLSLMVTAVAVWLRRTVPLVMTWTTVFVFCRLLGNALVLGFRYDPRWRLIDLWNDSYLVGCFCLGVPRDVTVQPAVWEAFLVLGALCLLCLIYLNLRIRAVEIVK
ncbi:MAG TPA: ABC transporter permease subunit [Gemmataceae bacterium]|jgi:ABC-type transport system involved in multi-copper enzyme maturation permease subunit|nr:ABC transporter permease subunit [Gemmataceae bacterium]